MPRRLSFLRKSGAPVRTGKDDAARAQRDRSALHFGTLHARIAALLGSLFGMCVGTGVILFATGILRVDDSFISATGSRLALVGLGLIELVLVLALGVALARTITQPLADLLRATRSVTKGRKARVLVESGDEIGKLAQSFNVMVDAIEARERRITHVALHDALTGLPNRKYFGEQLEQALARRKAETRVLVAYIDLDDFKMVNDTLGHAAGDRLLCDVAAKLQAALPEGVIARLSGDEFAAMIPAVPADSDLAAIGMRLQGCFAQDIVLDGRAAQTSASIGIAVAPEDGAVGSELLKNADLALYRAKQQGKAGHHFFETALDERAKHRRRMELDLRATLREGGLALHFQPLYSLSEERLTAFEALVRWPHPTLGLVAPNDFIPLAEETGLITQIGEWVMREACRQAQAWPEPLSVAVNLSSKQFLSPSLPAMVVHALASTGLPPQRLEVEITESAFIANVDKTLETLHALQGLGVRITLDDFGTGYTSLSHLRLFPFDKLKIDQSFVHDLAPVGNAHAVIRAITTLADALGIETLAEGVEDPAQLAVLRQEGCGQIQGYLLSRPIEGEEVPRFIVEQRARAKVVRLRA